MDNFSVPQDYSAISDDIEIGNITLDVSSMQDYNILSGDTITLTTGAVGAGTVTIGNIGAGSYTYATGSGAGISATSIDTINIGNIWGNTTEWVDGFPEWDRIQEMCQAYPGLKIAFDRFKVVYDLVKDDFDSPPEKRIKP